ncbi:MAG: F0F1 ATP synthase subunit A [Oligoflexales bacterium]
MKKLHFLFVLLLSFGIHSNAWASAGGVKIISYYEILLGYLGVHEHEMHDWVPAIGGLVTLFLLTLVGFLYKSRVERLGENVCPDGRFSIRTIVETLLDFVSDLGKSLIGEKHYRSFLPLLCTLFLFIFVSNLTGLVPGFVPSTESINTNLAMGISVFLVYNFAGFKEHGSHYIQQFLGPVVFLMPLMLIIELVAHFARPISLSLRLYGNIFGDHLVLSVFTGLTYLILPSFLLFFGLLVASLQSFVFTLLSGIYISMAMSHDH